MEESVRIRKDIEERWNAYLSRHGALFSSDTLSGTTPPTVFVGSHGYPRVRVGPMVPPVHGDTSMMDSPERWSGRTLAEIVSDRLRMVRGVRTVRADAPAGRYVEDLQGLAMSGGPADSDLRFDAPAAPVALADGYSAPFGPVGSIQAASYSGLSSPHRAVERAYYDTDRGAAGAVMDLYGAGVEVSRIHRLLSMGMLGRGGRRRLVPTRWSIAAADSTISEELARRILDYPQIDSHEVFFHEHLGNLFAVVLFPHRWMFEMIEAWYAADGAPGFGADREGARGMGHRQPAIAGAYFAGRLAVAEHLERRRAQAGALVLREIRPEYAVPVGVWQVREGVRAAMSAGGRPAPGLDEAVEAACAPLGISMGEWLAHGQVMQMARQRTLADFF